MNTRIILGVSTAFALGLVACTEQTPDPQMDMNQNQTNEEVGQPGIIEQENQEMTPEDNQMNQDDSLMNQGTPSEDNSLMNDENTQRTE